jgi:predicted DCC family thiol-disulfide oxidoreductase YuxK
MNENDGCWHDHPIIFFDGYCILCSSAVIFIIKRDYRQRFVFSTLQSLFAKKTLDEKGHNPAYPESLILYEKGQIFMFSTAVLKIVQHLRFPWNLLFIFMFIPRPIRDRIYRWFADKRYRWFGRKDSCFIPTSDITDRFIL